MTLFDVLIKAIDVKPNLIIIIESNVNYQRLVSVCQNQIGMVPTLTPGLFLENQLLSDKDGPSQRPKLAFPVHILSTQDKEIK